MHTLLARSPLCWAAVVEVPAAAKAAAAALLGAGADARARGGPHGTTALHEAAANRSPEAARAVIAALLAAGADPLAVDGSGRLPLHHLRASSGAVGPLADAVSARWQAQERALRAARAEREDLETCVVCLTGRRDTALLPCGHFALCSACARKLQELEEPCPVCRAMPEGAASIHLS